MLKQALTYSLISLAALGAVGGGIAFAVSHPEHNGDFVKTFCFVISSAIAFECWSYLRTSVGVAINNRNEG